MSLVIPMALFAPQLIDTGILIIAPGEFSIHNRLGDLLSADDCARHLDLLADIGDQGHLGHLASKRSLGEIGVDLQLL